MNNIAQSTKHHNTRYTWFTPSVGLRPPTLHLLYYLLSMNRATKMALHRSKYLLAPHQILLPQSWHNTEPSYNHLHLALQVLNTQYAKIIYNNLHLAHWITIELAPLTTNFSPPTYIAYLSIYILQNGPKHG
jgi:hypothetical protein